MSDDLEHVETTPPEPEANPPPEPASVDDPPPADPPERGETETLARSMGWVPKDEFRGNPDQWRDADEFVKHGEQELPILRERNRALARRIDEQEKQSRANFERLEKMNTVALKRQRDQIINAYEAEIQKAVELGDVDTYRRLKHDQGQAVRAHDVEVQQTLGGPLQPQPNGQQQNGQQPAQLTESEKGYLDDWTTKNRWFTTDREMSAVAESFHVQLWQQKPGLSLEENLKQTEAYVRRRYPEKFGDTQQPPSAVEGGGRMPSSPRSKGVNELPPDAKKQGKRFVEEGLYKDLAEYAKDYHTQ